MLKDEKIIDVANREYYNALRTNIKFLGKDFQVISITSVSSGEGKSVVSLNLAISLAQTDARVLYIDADTRNSAFAGRVHIGERKGGLTNYLVEDYPLEEILHKTEIPGLHIIHSGKYAVNPTNLLQSKRFADLLKTLRSHYQYIIIDTPPIGLVVDAAIITNFCDGSILVIESGKIKRKFVQKAIQNLQQTGKSFLGIILNKLDVSKNYYRGYGNYGSYGKCGK